MDKELLRIVIIATGFLVMLGMIAWSFIKNRRLLERQDEFDHEPVIGSSGAINNSLRLHTEHDDFDIVPLGAARHTLEKDDDSDWGIDIDDDFVPDEEEETPARHSIPEIIQFAVVAKTDAGFNGIDLQLAFTGAGLEYGSTKVFERKNANGGVDYGVACMVEPGTFPDGVAIAGFSCPGIVFYLQHGDLEDAQDVFEDFVYTVQRVAEELDGDVWDNKRQPLTEETIDNIRHSL